MTLWFLATSAAPAATASNDAYLVWGAVLFAVAIVLLVVELFVPSGGLIGILAGIAAIGSVISFFLFDPAWGLGVLLTYLILFPIFIAFIFKYWLNSPFGRRLVLGGEQTRADDPQSAAAVSEEERRERVSMLASLIGAEGTTETALRPVGTIRIGNQRIDGMAEHGIIDPGTTVIVVDVYDNQIKVRPK